MRILLDTHVLIAMTKGRLSATYPNIAAGLARSDVQAWASVASLWEIAIKTRLGKLAPGIAVPDLATFLETAGVTILPIDREHVVADITPIPRTRDPFDRLLLAQCRVENLRLVTVDGALQGHPLVLGSF